MSAFPLLRFDPRLPRAWYHRYQHIYMALLWAPVLLLLEEGGDGGGLDLAPVHESFSWA